MNPYEEQKKLSIYREAKSIYDSCKPFCDHKNITRNELKECYKQCGRKYNTLKNNFSRSISFYVE